MKASENIINQKAVGWALALILLAASYRVISGIYLTALPNFSPAMAVVFCGALVLPGALAIAAPLGSLFLSDLLLNAHFGQPLIGPGMIASYACYLLAIGIGFALRGARLMPLLGATVGNSVVFYIVTNSLSWWANPHYAQTGAGWIQALTVGLPGFPPTWTFFRNSLVSDLLFTGVFLGVFYLAGRRASLGVAAGARSA